MVTAGKIFKTAEPTPLSDLEAKIKEYRKEEPYEEGEYKFTLITEITNVTHQENGFSGLYSHDYVTLTYHRGKIISTPRTMEALFSFVAYEDQVFLTILEKRRAANYVANKISEILSGTTGFIIEARIPPETLQDFHLKNRENTKVTFFDNIDIPNINKLSLYGSDLSGTNLFDEYCRHGDLWYIIIKSVVNSYIVGVTRDCCVTVFSKVTPNQYLEYVKKEIFPLII